MSMIEDAAERSGQAVRLPGEVADRVIVIHPGDSLVVAFDQEATMDELQNAAQMFREALPNVDIAIVNGELRLAVIRKDSDQ